MTVKANPNDISLFNDLFLLMKYTINLDEISEKESVTLIPCSHKVSKAALKEIKEKKENKCIQCAVTMTGYLTKDQSKIIVDLLSKMSEDFKIRHRLASSKEASPSIV